MDVTLHPDGDTILTGEILDRSALDAILNRLHATDIKLVSVEEIETPNG